MGAQLLIAPGEVFLCIPVEVAERRRQAVAAVLFRHAAQRPQRVLQPFGERHEALAAAVGTVERRLSLIVARQCITRT
jgi:hypothetical protein